MDLVVTLSDFMRMHPISPILINLSHDLWEGRIVKRYIFGQPQLAHGVCYYSSNSYGGDLLIKYGNCFLPDFPTMAIDINEVLTS